jgi:hypothetical protein
MAAQKLAEFGLFHAAQTGRRWPMKGGEIGHGATESRHNVVRVIAWCGSNHCLI